MRSWHDDAPTSPFVNKEKHCAFKRPSCTGIPVLVSCIVLKGPLNCCLRAVSQLGDISSHFRTEFGFYSSYVYSFPFSSWKDRVSQFHCLFGPWNFFLLGGGGSSSSLDVAVLSLCLPWTQWLAPLDSPDGPGRGSPGSSNGNWLISSCATPFNTVPFALLHLSASGIGNMWGHVRLGLLGKEQCCRCLFVQFPFISICWIHSPVSFEFHSVFFLISCFQIICSSPMDQSSTNSSIGSLSKEKTSSKSRNPFHLCYPEWITFQWSTSFHRMDIFWEWS